MYQRKASENVNELVSSGRKVNVLNMIYSDRSERLVKSGIVLSREEFIVVANV